MDAPADLEWTLTKQADHLQLHYRITSRAKARFYICDLLPVSSLKGWSVANQAVIVSNGAPDSVRFIRGRLRSETPLPVLIDPGARAIDPGQTLEGSADVKLPLTAWHYQGTAAAIKGKPHWAVLEIGYLFQAHWEELPLATGGKLTISNPSDAMSSFQFERKAIPQ